MIAGQWSELSDFNHSRTETGVEWYKPHGIRAKRLVRKKTNPLSKYFSFEILTSLTTARNIKTTRYFIYVTLTMTRSYSMTIITYFGECGLINYKYFNFSKLPKCVPKNADLVIKFIFMTVSTLETLQTIFNFSVLFEKKTTNKPSQ